MDMLNKLKSAVSNVLPGNPLSRDFDFQHQFASTGPGLLWKVYSATKKSTKEEASVFLFEKKSVDRFSRGDRDAIIDLLRIGAQQLTKLRHPKILAVIQPLEESREALAFATEPVFASLANILGDLSSISTVTRELQEYQLFDVEIKHGLLQLTEGLGFLHNDAKILHRNICPEAIVLTKLGSWKLAGFEFCVRSSDLQSSEASYPFHDWRTNVAPVTQPNLDFLAPEYVLTKRCGPASDMFSLGLLIYAVFAKGKSLFECHGEMAAFKENTEELRHMRISLLGAVPEELREHIKLLLNIEPTVRPDAAQLSKVPFFEDVGCVTLQYMDTLFQRQNIEKSNFFKGLPKVIAKLPKRVSLQRILPALFKEAMNTDMVPFLLPNILLTAEQATEAEYKAQILPQLIPLFKLKEPVQIVLLFLQNMNLLLSKTPKSDIQNHVLPMLFRALEADSPQIQELCLSIIPTFAELIEYSTLKNSLVPRIKKLCLDTAVLTVRVNCLLCLGQLMEHMDKWFVLDEILPFLQKIPSREPAVLMTVLGIHKVAFEGSKLGITKDTLANKVVPFLIPLAMDNNLNLSQFNAFMSLIRDMISKMETEHRGKLEQLDQMKQEQRSIEISRVTSSEGGDLTGNANCDRNPTMMDKFLSGFGLGQFMSSQSQKGGGEGFGNPDPVPSATPNGTAISATSTPAIPPAKKASLTMEEKQRLAQQQEQQERLKSQNTLTPKASTTRPSATPGSQASKAKDLTSTLMASNINSMQSMSVGQSKPASQPNYNVNTWASGPSNSGGGSAGLGGGFAGVSGTTSVGYGQSAFGMQPRQGFGTMGSMNMNSSASRTSSTGSGAKPDLSAFDSLMDSQKQKPSMNQMTQGGASNQMGGSGGMGPSTFNQPMGMNPQSMSMAMGTNPMGMGGSPIRLGAPIMGVQPGFGQIGMGGVVRGSAIQGHNSGFGGQLLSPTASGSSHKSSSNSIDDLLG